MIPRARVYVRDGIDRCVSVHIQYINSKREAGAFCSPSLAPLTSEPLSLARASSAQTVGGRRFLVLVLVSTLLSRVLPVVGLKSLLDDLAVTFLQMTLDECGCSVFQQAYAMVVRHLIELEVFVEYTVLP